MKLSPSTEQRNTFLEKKNQFYSSFLWIEFYCLKAVELLWIDSLPLTIKSPEIPRTHLIDLGKMKDWVILELPGGFELGTHAWESSNLAKVITP